MVSRISAINSIVDVSSGVLEVEKLLVNITCAPKTTAVCTATWLYKSLQNGFLVHFAIVILVSCPISSLLIFQLEKGPASVLHSTMPLSISSSDALSPQRNDLKSTLLLLQLGQITADLNHPCTNTKTTPSAQMSTLGSTSFFPITYNNKRCDGSIFSQSSLLAKSLHNFWMKASKKHQGMRKRQIFCDLQNRVFHPSMFRTSTFRKCSTNRGISTDPLQLTMIHQSWSLAPHTNISWPGWDFMGGFEPCRGGNIGKNARFNSW